MSLPWLSPATKGKDYETRTKCSLCRSDHLVDVLDLGKTPLANEFVRKRGTKQLTYPLSVVLCARCGHAQTSIVVSPKKIFEGYAYATGTSPSTVAHLRDQARTIRAVVGSLGYEMSVLEIGSNDGTLLEELAAIGIPRENIVGVEPAVEISRKSRMRFEVVGDFFTSMLATKIDRRFDVVVANNVLAHMPDVRDAIEGASLALRPNGILVMEVAHAMDVFDGAFDTIYHEHASYHALGPLVKTLELVGLHPFMVEKTGSQVGRGSLRVYAGRSRSRTNVEEAKFSEILTEEKKRLACHPDGWRKAGEQIASRAAGIRKLVEDASQGGRAPVAGYGAPAKMTTLMAACAIDPKCVAFVADDAPAKQGLFTPGYHVPVVHPDEISRRKPSHVVAFAWNFFDGITDKLKASGWKGSLWRPLPEVEESVVR